MWRAGGARTVAQQRRTCPPRHGVGPSPGQQAPWRRAWQPTPVSLPEESHGEEPGGLQTVGTQSQTQLRDYTTTQAGRALRRTEPRGQRSEASGGAEQEAPCLNRATGMEGGQGHRGQTEPTGGRKAGPGGTAADRAPRETEAGRGRSRGHRGGQGPQGAEGRRAGRGAPQQTEPQGAEEGGGAGKGAPWQTRATGAEGGAGEQGAPWQTERERARAGRGQVLSVLIPKRGREERRKLPRWAGNTVGVTLRLCLHPKGFKRRRRVRTACMQGRYRLPGGAH